MSRERQDAELARKEELRFAQLRGLQSMRMQAAHRPY